MQISQKPVKRQKIVALDFIRAICAVGVVLYHLSCYSAPDAPKFGFSFANGTGDVGRILVGVFLLMSGGVLFYNYGKDVTLRAGNLRIYAYKRWKSIFPMFYVAFLYYYLKDVLASGAIFYLGRPWSMILSVLGMDGYFLYRGLNYYRVGEWFLGAIILLYALYPFYAKLLNKYGERILLVLVPVWLWQTGTDVFTIDTSRNLIYCSGLFIVGMIIFRRELYRNKVVKGISLPISLILLSLPVYAFDGAWYLILYNARNILLIISLFFTLYTVGELIMKIPGLRGVVSFVSGVSFPIFLVQNQIGTAIVGRFNPMTLSSVIKAACVTVILCVVAGWCVQAIANQIMLTKWFGRIDKYFLTEKTGGQRIGPDNS